MQFFYGSLDQHSSTLPDSDYIGLQCTVIAYVALIYVFVGEACYNSKFIDEVIIVGHNMYVDYLKSQNSRARMIGHNELPPNVLLMDGISVSANILIDRYHGVLNTLLTVDESFQFGLTMFEQALLKALQDSAYLLITIGLSTISLFQLNNKLNIFDSHSHQHNPAFIIQFDNIADIKSHLLNCYGNYQQEFEISPIHFELNTASDVVLYSQSISNALSCSKPAHQLKHGTSEPTAGTDNYPQVQNLGILNNSTSKTNANLGNVTLLQSEQCQTETENAKVSKVQSVIDDVCEHAFRKRRNIFPQLNDRASDCINAVIARLFPERNIDNANKRSKVTTTKDLYFNKSDSSDLRVLADESNILGFSSPPLDNLSRNNSFSSICDGNPDNMSAAFEDIIDAVHEEHKQTDISAFERISAALPNSSCVSCHKFLFPDQIVHCHHDNFANQFNFQFDSSSDLCHTCCRKLKLKTLPSKHWQNNLQFPIIPKHFNNLNIIEKRFISQLQTYLTLVVLPGGQFAEHGLAIHFPFNIVEHVARLPCSIENSNLICVSGNIKRYIKKEKLLTCLQWLQKHNHLYKDIIIDNDQTFCEERSCASNNFCNIRFEESGAIPSDHVVKFPISKGQPVSYEDEPDSEALAFPWLHPFGTSHYQRPRPLHLTILKYFQSRFLAKNNLYRSDIPYLIVSVNNYEKLLLRTIVGVYCRIYKQYTDHATNNGSQRMLTAKDTRSPNFKHELMYGFNSYMFAKQIRGTVAYWRNELWNLLARVKLLGPPNIFLTLSAADTQWPDLKAILLSDANVAERTCSLNNLVRQNPVLAAVYFERRYRAFCKHILRGKTNPLGKIVDHWSRVEFQNRGSPHIHMFLWIESAPSFEKGNTGDQIVSYIDNIISSEIPCDTELKNLVLNVQVHRHTKTCSTYSSTRCRFHYPKSECLRTKILPENLSSHGRVFYATKRSSEAAYINAYNPYLLSVWKANMDIQLVNGIAGLAIYVCNYVCKEEPDDLRSALQNLFDESAESTQQIRIKLFKIGMCVLKHRQMSAQEAAFRICHLPLVDSSRECVSINTFLPDKRMKRLKTRKDLNELPDDSNEIFCDSIIDKYRCRPTHLEDCTLYNYASQYKIKTVNNAVVVTKRTKHGAIRTPHFTPNTEQHFYSLLLLHYPNRSEEELVEDFSDVKEAFSVKFSQIPDQGLQKEHHIAELFNAISKIQCIRQYQDEIEQVRLRLNARNPLEINQNEEQCPPQLPPTSHINSINCEPLSVDELIQEASAFGRLREKSASSQLTVKNLTRNQLLIFEHIRTRVSNNDVIKTFITGEAGTGKSYLLKTIISWLQAFYCCTDSNKAVLITAPTGIAALNVSGSTLHSALSLPVQHGREPSTMAELSQISLKRLRLRYKNLRCIVIDEISMVSSKMLDFINARLSTIMQNNYPFGNLNVIVCGDFFQLKPVRGQFAFKNAILWPLFQPVFLTENVRQAKDLEYAKLLSRARIGALNSQDIKVLQTRIVNPHNTQHLVQTLHLYPTCKQVSTFNEIRQRMMPNKIHDIDSVDIFSASDNADGCLVPVHMIPKDARSAGGFFRTLQLSIGTRVMLLRNLCCEDGLVNGVLGTVARIEADEEKVDLIDVKFDDDRIGNFFKDRVTNTVSISRHSVDYRYKGRFLTRIQFPLAPSWACTIHKSQGISLTEAVINIGKNIFASGQSYVALSRVQTLSGLFIEELCTHKCYADEEVVTNELHMLKVFEQLRTTLLNM